MCVCALKNTKAGRTTECKCPCTFASSLSWHNRNNACHSVIKLFRCHRNYYSLAIFFFVSLPLSSLLLVQPSCSLFLVNRLVSSAFCPFFRFSALFLVDLHHLGELWTKILYGNDSWFFRAHFRVTLEKSVSHIQETPSQLLPFQWRLESILSFSMRRLM